MEFAEEIAGGLPAVVRGFGEALSDEAIERGRGHRLDGGDRRWIGGHHGRDEARLAGAHETSAAGDHLVEHCAEGEDVGARVGLFAFELLGRHVGIGSEDGAFDGERGWLGYADGLACGG